MPMNKLNMPLVYSDLYNVYSHAQLQNIILIYIIYKYIFNTSLIFTVTSDEH